MWSNQWDLLQHQTIPSLKHLIIESHLICLMIIYLWLTLQATLHQSKCLQAQVVRTKTGNPSPSTITFSIKMTSLTKTKRRTAPLINLVISTNQMLLLIFVSITRMEIMTTRFSILLIIVMVLCCMIRIEPNTKILRSTDQPVMTPDMVCPDLTIWLVECPLTIIPHSIMVQTKARK